MRARYGLAVLLSLFALVGCDVVDGGPTTVPNVVGLHLDDAKSRLQQAGLDVSPVDDSSQDRGVANYANWVVRSQSPKAGAAADKGDAVTVNVYKPTDSRAVLVQTGVIPDVKCKDLLTAEYLLNAAGYFDLHNQDGNDEARRQGIDQNWLVISQKPKPGTRAPEGERIIFNVVKYGEPTGNSGCKS